MIWNWDNIQYRAEYPEAAKLFLGHPVVYDDESTRVHLVRSPAGGFDTEDRFG